jgi:hypothetical protein
MAQVYIDAIKNASKEHQIMLGLLVAIIALMLYRSFFKSGAREEFQVAGKPQPLAERQNLVTRMTESQYIQMKNQPMCKAASEKFCNAYCNDGLPQEVDSAAENVMNICGKQFPVLRTCPAECTLPKWTQMQGGFNGSVMTDKVFSSYINPFTSDSTLPPVGEKLNWNGTWESPKYN